MLSVVGPTLLVTGGPSGRGRKLAGLNFMRICDR